MGNPKNNGFKISCLNRCFKPRHDNKLTSSNSNSNSISNNHASSIPLPMDIEKIILSKLDLTTLYRCTMVSPHEFTPVVRQLTAISTTLPSSMFLPGKSHSFFGRPLLSATKKLLNSFIRSGSLPFYVYLSGGSLVSLLMWLHQPKLSPSGKRFFRTLVGLKWFELHLPPTPFLDYLTSRGYWFRWEAKLGSRNYKDDYLIIVAADIVHDNGNVLFRNVDAYEVPTIPGVCHVMYHLSTMNILVGKSPNENFAKLNSFVCKDVGKNGKLEVNVENMNTKESCQNEGMSCLVPTTLTLNNNDTDNNSTRLRNTWLWYLRWEDDNSSENGGGGGVKSSADELMKSCVEYLKVGEEKEDEEEERKELRNVVTQIISHNDKILHRQW